MSVDFWTGIPSSPFRPDSGSGNWRVADIVIVDGYAYKVIGIYLGMVDQVNMIGLKCLSEKMGNATGPDVEEMLVPERILNAAVKGGACHTRNVI